MAAAAAELVRSTAALVWRRTSLPGRRPGLDSTDEFELEPEAVEVADDDEEKNEEDTPVLELWPLGARNQSMTSASRSSEKTGE